MAESIVESSTEAVLNVAKTGRIRVLHVDDDQAFLKAAKRCLDAQGEFEVETTSSVNEALERLKKTDYDAIVSDYQMPGKDGLEFLKELRKMGNTVPFIVFTGKGREEVVAKALNLGADQYIDKHGDPETVYHELAHGIRVAVERNEAIEELSSERDRLETVTRNVGAGLALISKDYRTLWANEVLKQIFGDVEGKVCYSTYNQRHDVCPECGAREIFENGKAKAVNEQVGKDVNGKTVWSEITATPVKDREGNITAALELVVPITQRKRAEEQLQVSETRVRESEERFRSIIENSSDQIFMLDRDCRFLSVNRTAAALFGMSPQGMVGRSIFEVFPETIAAQFSKNVKNVLDTGKSMHIDEKMVVKGRELYSSTSLNPVRNDSGMVMAVCGIVRDITERKKVEEEKSRLLQDLHQRVKELNCLYGMSRLVEKPHISLDDVLQGTADLLPLAMKYPDNACARVVLENREFSTKNFKETGWKLHSDFSVLGKKVGFVEVCYLEERPTVAEGPFHEEEGRLIDAVAERLEKVTESMRAKEMLQESEERFRAIFEGANDGILAADVKTRRFSFANPRMCQIAGYSLEELLKLGVGDIHLKKDLPYVIDSFEKQKQGKVALSEGIPVLRKDGRVVYCDVTSKRLKIGGQECLVGFFRDVTERRKAEEERREIMEKLQMTNEKLRVVGSLTRHDVNNKLAAIAGNAYLAKKLPGNSEVLDYMLQIEASVKQTVQIFDFARTYEMLGAEELAYVDVEKSVDEAVSLFSGLKGIKVINDCHGLTVLADSLLRQLFYNLIDDSLKYGEKLSYIRVYYEDKNDHLNLTYEDDGVGIPQAEKLKLFGEGYTTGKGSGYGLFLVKKMMEVYGWTIQERGEPGKGVQFTITISRTNTDGKENYRLS